MTFEEKLRVLKKDHEELLKKRNAALYVNGVYERYANPVLTAAHAPLFWRYDLDEASNPYLEERFGIHATFNSGAIKHGDKYLLCVRVEGADRKSFFAMAESPNGVDNFRFWDRPVTMPEWGEPATNVYDMRLTAHEDGWIYGVFCVERKDPAAAPGDLSSAVAAAGIARTRDFVTWERLPDLVSASQQRNVVLHPDFVEGKYAFYTRPQDGFIDAGSVLWTISPMPRSRRRRSSTCVITIPSRRSRTVKAPLPSVRRRAGCTSRTVCADVPAGSDMSCTCT